MHEVIVECKVCTERRKPAALEFSQRKDADDEGTLQGSA